jgi:hypothetical protein
MARATPGRDTGWVQSWLICADLATMAGIWWAGMATGEEARVGDRGRGVGRCRHAVASAQVVRDDTRIGGATGVLILPLTTGLKDQGIAISPAGTAE